MSTIPRYVTERQAGRAVCPKGFRRYDFQGRYFRDLRRAKKAAQEEADRLHASVEIRDRETGEDLHVFPREYRCQRCNHLLVVPPKTILSTIHRCERCAPQAWDIAVREALEKLAAAAPGSALLLPFLIKTTDGCEQIDHNLVAAYLGAERVDRRGHFRLWEADRV